MKKSKIYVIVQEDGELYCSAQTEELAQQIIEEDTKGGMDLANCFILSLDLWT